MITEILMNSIKVVMQWLLNLMPTPDLIVGAGLGGVAETFINMIQGAAYVFPVGDVMIMLGTWYSIYTFTIAWKLIQRLWDALPLT